MFHLTNLGYQLGRKGDLIYHHDGNIDELKLTSFVPTL